MDSTTDMIVSTSASTAVGSVAVPRNNMLSLQRELAARTRAAGGDELARRIETVTDPDELLTLVNNSPTREVPKEVFQSWANDYKDELRGEYQRLIFSRMSQFLIPNPALSAEKFADPSVPDTDKYIMPNPNNESEMQRLAIEYRKVYKMRSAAAPAAPPQQPLLAAGASLSTPEELASGKASEDITSPGYIATNQLVSMHKTRMQSALDSALAIQQSSPDDDVVFCYPAHTCPFAELTRNMLPLDKSLLDDERKKNSGIVNQIVASHFLQNTLVFTPKLLLLLTGAIERRAMQSYSVYFLYLDVLKYTAGTNLRKSHPALIDAVEAMCKGVDASKADEAERARITLLGCAKAREVWNAEKRPVSPFEPLFDKYDAREVLPIVEYSREEILLDWQTKKKHITMQFNVRLDFLLDTLRNGKHSASEVLREMYRLNFTTTIDTLNAIEMALMKMFQSVIPAQHRQELMTVIDPPQPGASMVEIVDAMQQDMAHWRQLRHASLEAAKNSGLVKSTLENALANLDAPHAKIFTDIAGAPTYEEFREFIVNITADYGDVETMAKGVQIVEKNLEAVIIDGSFVDNSGEVMSRLQIEFDSAADGSMREVKRTRK